MSHIIKMLTSTGPIPGNIPTSFVTDSGTIIAAANVVNINGGSSTSNHDVGIQVIANPNGSNNEVVELTNRSTGTVTTADNTITTIITFPMGVTAGTIYVYGNVQAFNASTPASAAYSFSGGYRTDGITATELGTEFHDTFQDPALTASDIFLTTSGNNILVQVEGINGLSINWNALLEYRMVN